MPESTSEDETASRRPKLPSESQVNSAGGGPWSATVSSISRRTRASTTTERMPLILAAATPDSCIAIRVESSWAAVARSVVISVASLIARRSMIGVLVSAASRSMSVATPSSSPRLERIGTWRMPRSIIVSINSALV